LLVRAASCRIVTGVQITRRSPWVARDDSEVADNVATNLVCSGRE
jgi:hypothetical protein